MNATITLQQGMHFTASADGSPIVNLDSSPNAGGTGLGPTPMQFMLFSLGGCTAMDVLSILRKKRQNVTGFEVRVSGERATEHPKVFTHITIEFVVRGVDINPAAVERAIQLSSDIYCSAQAMVKQTAIIRTIYTIVPEPDVAVPI
ncbi:MAG: OsmC family protein [Chloroflexota bacterium]|jgi:putative redox protein